MYVPEGPLTRAQIDAFRRDGYIQLKGCIPTGPGTLAQRWMDRAWERLGLDRNDPDGWKTPRIHMPIESRAPVEEVAPSAFAAMCQLMGGRERMAGTVQTGDGFIINFGIGRDRPWQGPGPEVGGWHKDGDWFLHFLDSPEQGLLSIFCWGEMRHRGGATFVACDSVGHIARFLAQHPEGVSPFSEPGIAGLPPEQPRFPFKDVIARCTDFRECVADAGDVFLIHPFLLHTASQNHLRKARFITNPAISFSEPMRFDRPDGKHCVVEQCILDALGVDRFPFRPTAERKRLVPPRVEQEKRYVAR